MSLSRYAICFGATALAGALLITNFDTSSQAADRPASAKSGAHRATSAPTFNKDIAPILFNHCASCHRPGLAAPFALTNYQDAKSRAKLLAQITRSGLMPPWKAGPSNCELKDVNRLTEGQIALMERWAETGMKEGASKPPPLPSFPQGWQLGKPDLIVKMPKAWSVPADGPDIYRTFVVPLHLTEDKWVTAIEYHPSARKSVHHCLFFYDATDNSRSQDGADGEPGIRGALPGRKRRGGGAGGGLFGGLAAEGGLLSSSLGGEGGSADAPGSTSFGSLGGWAVGANPSQLPEGLAYYLPKGSDLLLSTHFHMSGKPDEEASEVGLYFTKKAPQKRFTSIQLPPAFGAVKGINIPAGDKDWMLTDSFVLPADAKAFGVTGHAHFLAREMRMTATLPDGTTKTLLTIPKWDFAWQGQYQYKQFEALPKGTRLDVAIRYDNSSDNPSNPFSPPHHIFWGTQSTAEMGSITLQMIAAKDEDMPALKQAYFQHVREQFQARRKAFGFGSDGE